MSFFCEFLWTLRNSIFVEHLRTTTSVLGKSLKKLAITYDLAKYLTTLTIKIDFGVNI